MRQGGGRLDYENQTLSSFLRCLGASHSSPRPLSPRPRGWVKVPWVTAAQRGCGMQALGLARVCTAARCVGCCCFSSNSHQQQQHPRTNDHTLMPLNPTHNPQAKGQEQAATAAPASGGWRAAAAATRATAAPTSRYVSAYAPWGHAHATIGLVSCCQAWQLILFFLASHACSFAPSRPPCMWMLEFAWRALLFVSLTPFSPIPTHPTLPGGGPLPSHQQRRGKARLCAHRLHRHGTTPNQDQLWSRNEESEQVLHLRSCLWSLRHARRCVQADRRSDG